MTEQRGDLDVVDLYCRKINSLGLGVVDVDTVTDSKRAARVDDTGSNDAIDIDAELDYTLQAAVRHLSIWGPGVRAVNLKALKLRVEQLMDDVPAEHCRHYERLSRARDYINDCMRPAGNVSPVSRTSAYQSAM